MGTRELWGQLRGQIYLGDERFVERMQARVGLAYDVNIPRAQRRPPAPSLGHIEREQKERDAAVVAAHATGQYSYEQIGKHFGLHFTCVGRIVRSTKRRGGRSAAKRRICAT